MTDNEILAEVKKGLCLHFEGTYDMKDLFNHMLCTIRDSQEPLLEHKRQMERLMFKIDELRETQRLYHGGHKNLLGKVKKMEQEMDMKIHALQTMGYSISRFKNKVVQNTLL